MALTSKLWPRSRPQGPVLGRGLGLEILASFNIAVSNRFQLQVYARSDSTCRVDERTQTIST